LPFYNHFIIEIKQLPLAKIVTVPKTLKPLKAQIVEFLKQNYGAFTFEHVGTVRSKPTLKLPPSTIKNINFSVNDYGVGGALKLPSPSILLRDIGNILRANLELHHIEVPKI
jgi:hypothetical protein